MKNLFIILLLYLNSFSLQAQDVKTYIPEKAFQYFPTIKSETSRLMPDIIYPHYFGALIEHESCISFKHKKCWTPEAELLSKREQGVGLLQITRTFRPDGSIRFDSLSDMRKAHMEELRELSWENVKQRPDLQIRTMILMTRDNYKALFEVGNNEDRLHMSDAAYNGGLRDLRKERLECGLAQGCDPDIWFGNVELKCIKGKEPLYGKRSACDINRHHVKDVFKVKLNKYEPHLRLVSIEELSVTNLTKTVVEDPIMLSASAPTPQPDVFPPKGEFKETSKESDKKESGYISLGKIGPIHIVILTGVIGLIIIGVAKK